MLTGPCTLFIQHTAWWFIPRLVSGLVHPSYFSGLTLQKSHVNHWGYTLTHFNSPWDEPPSALSRFQWMGPMFIADIRGRNMGYHLGFLDRPCNILGLSGCQSFLGLPSVNLKKNITDWEDSLRMHNTLLHYNILTHIYIYINIMLLESMANLSSKWIWQHGRLEQDQRIWFLSDVSPCHLSRLLVMHLQDTLQHVGLQKGWSSGELTKSYGKWPFIVFIVDFPIKNGDFPWQNVSSPEGTTNHNKLVT